MNSDPVEQDSDFTPETAEEVYQSLARAIRRKQGFGLFFVQCSPVKGDKIIASLQADLPQKTMQVLTLEKSSQTLYDRVESLAGQETIDILFIKGLEASLISYEDTKRLAGWGSKEVYSYSWKGVPPILRHLNLQREQFRDTFNFCLVFLIPYFVVKYFVQRAPDFFDWRSGLFIFPRDADELEQRSRKITQLHHHGQDKVSLQECNQGLLEIRELLEDVRLQPQHQAELLVSQGKLYDVVEEYDAAVVSFNKAIEADPLNYKAWYGRGNVLQDLGRFQEAQASWKVATWTEAIVAKEDNADAWFNRGVGLEELGRYGEAITSYDKALQVKPDYQEAWFRKGYALGELQR
ncbi:MAG TPA: tetratricopeptide repeat protein, partial [Stenomitos sp.]